MPTVPSDTEVLGDVELLIPTRRIDCVTMSYGRHRRQPHPQLTIRTSSAPSAWSKCPVSSAQARLLRLLRVSLATLGGVITPHEEADPLSSQPVLELATSNVADAATF